MRAAQTRTLAPTGDERDGNRSRELIAIVHRAAARSRAAADDSMAEERHRAADEVERAVSAVLNDLIPRLDDTVSSEVFSAVLHRMCSDARAELARRGPHSPDSALRLWAAFDAAGQALARRRPVPGLLAEPELSAVNDVVHDLRSPLSSILLLSETLYGRHRLAGDPLSQRQAGLIYGAALAMHGLVSSVRDLARGAYTLMDPVAVRFQTGEIMDTIGALVRPLAEEKGLAFRVAIPPRLMLTGHPTALTRVLLNLVTNGLKFTESGFVEIEVTTPAGGGAQFVVRDSGSGLPERVAALVNGDAVVPLERAEASVSGELGVGLGLLLSVRLARLMSGTLRVEHTGTTGTCFVLDLPLAMSPEDVLRGALSG